MGVGIGNVDADIAVGQQLAASNPLSAGKLPKLGGIHAGTGGVFSMFNFLYSYIKIDSISLSDTLAAYNASHGSNFKFADLRGQNLIFQPGSSRPGDSAWSPLAMFGVLECGIDLHYHNPDDDSIATLSTQG